MDYIINSAYSEISRVSRPHVERFHEALEQLPPTTSVASGSSSDSECAEHSIASIIGSEDHLVDVAFDEVRALPFWNDSDDSGKFESSILVLYYRKNNCLYFYKIILRVYIQ